MTAESRERAATNMTAAYLLYFAAAITVPLALLVGALLFQAASEQREQLNDRISQVRDAIANNLDREFDRDITILHTLATSQALLNEDWRSFYDQAKAGLQGRAYLVLVDPAGRQLVNTYVPYGKQPATTGDPETVRRIAEIKAPIISNLFVSKVVRKPVFNVSIPVMRDGQLRYVMSLGLLPDDLVNLLAAQKLGADWVVTIWDAHGVVLARSRDAGRFVGTTLPSRLRESGHNAVVRTSNLDGQDVLHATATSQLSGWSIGVNVPYTLITEPMRTSLMVWGAAAAASIAIALALGVFFARQIMTMRVVISKLGAETASTEALARQRERLIEADPNGILAIDASGHIRLMNTRLASLFGYAPEELMGQPVEILLPQRFRGDHARLRAAFSAHPSTRSMGAGRELFGLRKDGSEFPVEIGLGSFGDGENEMSLAVVSDITQRKQLEARERMLVGELRHRSKNLFSMVLALATRSLRGPQSLDTAREVFIGRLKALSRTDRRLTDTQWQGMALEQLVRSEMEPFGDRFDIGGDMVILNPRATQNFALALHELATNASKYGALSNAGGKVEIQWRTAGDILKFRWQERGGPEVSSPDHRGFGSALLRATLGQAHVEFAKSGLIYEVDVPLRTIAGYSAEPEIASVA